MDNPVVTQSEPMVIESIEDVDQVLKVLGANSIKRLAVQQKADEAIAAISRQVEVAIAPLDEQDALIRASLTTYLLKRRKSLLRRFGKTIRVMHGVVTWVVKARSVGPINDPRDAIRYLEGHPDGEQYLTQTTTLNKGALAACSDENLLRALRRRGVRVSKHELLSVKPDGYPKPLQLSHRLYPRRR